MSVLTGEAAVETVRAVAVSVARARARREVYPPDAHAHLGETCQHHASTYMGGVVYGLATALGVLTGIDSEAILADITKAAEL